MSRWSTLPTEVVDLIQAYLGEDETSMFAIWSNVPLKYQPKPPKGYRNHTFTNSARWWFAVLMVDMSLSLNPHYTFKCFRCSYCENPLVIQKMIQRRLRLAYTKHFFIEEFRKDRDFLEWKCDEFVLYKGNRVCMHCYKRRFTKANPKKSDLVFRKYFEGQGQGQGHQSSSTNQYCRIFY